MAVLRRRRKRRAWGDFLSQDPCDGLEVNTVNQARRASRYSSSFSLFDADDICIELDSKKNGRRFHNVSIMCEVRHINISKTRNINGYKERIKGR